MIFAILFSLLTPNAPVITSAPSAAEPVKVIFDTDIGNDVDDVHALAMLHSLESRGMCELLAVTVSKDHPKAADFTRAVNQFYGRPEIPVGLVKDGATQDEGKFLKLADEFPHESGGVEEAVTLLRKTLAGQEDGSVVLIQVGFFTNLARLLDSPGDEFSPLNGKELIRQKVKLLSLMAGAFQTVGDRNRYLEYNVIKDIPAARKLAEEWPGPMIWSGFEIGIAAAYPHQSILEDYEYVPKHPVKESYLLYEPPPHDRPVWDLTSVLVAVMPERGYFGFSGPGEVLVEEDGFTRFTPGKDGAGRSRFLKMDALQTERVREACVQLSVQPPDQR